MANRHGDGKSAFDRILRWVVGITAILSLFFGVQKVTQLITENNTRSRQLAELKQVASMQRKGGDYSLAWASLESAMRLAESGGTAAKLFGKLDAETADLRVAREDLAMDWLDNIRITSGQKFGDVVEKLVPILVQGAVSAVPQRKADLLAYVGWSYFLRNRDGGAEFDATLQYREAAELDPQNPFAHAFWAHWILWHGGEVREANQHFAAALQSGRHHERVRALQLSALRNRGSDGDVAYIVVIGDMLKHGEVVQDEAKRFTLWHFSRACSAPKNEWLTTLKAAIPAAELAAIYDALAKREGTAEEQARRASCLAVFK